MKKDSLGRHPARRGLHIVFGGVLGAAWFVSPGSVFIILLVAAVSALLYRRVSPEDRRFVIILFLLGFLLRALLSVGLDVGSRLVTGQWPGKHAAPSGWDLGIRDQTREYVKMGDSDYLSQRGYAAAQFARGSQAPVVLYRLQQGYAQNGYTYVVGAFYYLFGFSPVAIKLVNCLIGALLGPALFALAKACFNAPIARWSSAVVTFFPSLLFWSASNLKDPAIHLLTFLLCWVFVQISRARTVWTRIGYGLLSIAMLWAHTTLRSAAYSLLLPASFLGAAGLLWAARRPWRLAAIGVLLAGALWTHPQPVQSAFLRAFSMHAGHVNTAGLSYRYLPDAYYASGYFKTVQDPGRVVTPRMLSRAVPAAVFHYLLEPLPRTTDNVLLWCALLQMMLWYLIVGLAAVGVWWSLRWNSRRGLFPVTALAAWLMVGALTNGNIGTVIRMRDMITPFVVLFAGAGGWALAGGWRIADGRALQDVRPGAALAS